MYSPQIIYEGGTEISEIQVMNLFRLFGAAGRELYIVGGYVRDKLLGEVSNDVDFATNALPEETVRILEENGLKAIPIGLEFGTVATLVEHMGETTQVEITTYRCSESYPLDSRHPDVVFGERLEEDLLRRDFTFNAMALSEEGELIDPFGGQKDLSAKLVRTPRESDITFREDPLRMLRAVRFKCRLGFELDPPVRDAIATNRKLILSISRERWKQEFDAMLTQPDGMRAVEAMQLLKDTGLLVEMIPEFERMFLLDDAPHGIAHMKNIWDHTMDVVEVLPPRLCLRWAAFLHDVGKADTRSVDEHGLPHYFGHENIGAELAGEIVGNFRFSRRDGKAVLFLIRNHMRPVLYDSEWSDAAVRRLVRDSGRELDDLLLLAEADIRAHTGEYSEKGLLNLAELRSRIGSQRFPAGQRLLPRELGRILASQLDAESEGGERVGLLLARLEDLVHEGKLPAMAAPSVYLQFLQDNSLISST